jgi:hypothetical protein
MDLMLADSQVLQRIIEDSLKKSVGEDGSEKIYANLRLREEKASNLLRSLNEVVVKGGYGLKVKEIFDKVREELSSRVEVRIIPNQINLIKYGKENVTVEVINRFDVPLVFEVIMEDRDNFLPVVFNKIDGTYFNKFSSESIIDTGEIGRFKFKVGWESDHRSPSTTLFVAVRSREIDGLNWLGKLRLDFAKD